MSEEIRTRHGGVPGIVGYLVGYQRMEHFTEEMVEVFTEAASFCTAVGRQRIAQGLYLG